MLSDMNLKECIRKDSRLNLRHSLYLPERNEENKKPEVKIFCMSTEIRVGHFPDTRQKRYPLS
jgi:hypothetical protein